VSLGREVKLLSVSVLCCPGVIDVGLKLHVTSPVPWQARAMGPVKLKGLPAWMRKVAVLVPRLMVCDWPFGALRPKATTPVPESARACGLPGALSVIARVPRIELDALGVKVTLTTQFDPAARELEELGHVLLLTA